MTHEDPLLPPPPLPSLRPNARGIFLLPPPLPPPGPRGSPSANRTEASAKRSAKRPTLHPRGRRREETGDRAPPPPSPRRTLGKQDGGIGEALGLLPRGAVAPLLSLAPLIYIPFILRIILQYASEKSHPRQKGQRHPESARRSAPRWPRRRPARRWPPRSRRRESGRLWRRALCHAPP